MCYEHFNCYFCIDSQQNKDLLHWNNDNLIAFPRRVELSDFREYGQSWNEEDVIGIELDMNARTLWFFHNDNFYGIAFKELEKCEYKAAISVEFAHDTTVRLCDEP